MGALIGNGQQQQMSSNNPYPSLQNALSKFIEGLAIGNESTTNRSMTQIENQFKIHGKESVNLNNKNKLLFNNLRMVRQFYFGKVDSIANNLSSFYLSFDNFFKLLDPKTVKNPQRLFTLFYQELEKEKLLDLQIFKKGKEQQDQQQETQIFSEQPINPQLQAFVTVFWIGKSFLGMIALKFKNKSNRDLKFNSSKQFYLNDNKDWIDPDIYTIIAQYFLWMTQIPSFSRLLDAYQNKRSINVLKLSAEKDLLDEDKLVLNSSSNFKERFRKITEEKAEIDQIWKLLHENFFSKEGEITVSQGRRDYFSQLVGKLQNLLGGGNSQQSQPSRMRGQQEEEQSFTEKIATSHQGKISSTKQDKETINQLKQKLQLIEDEKQKLQKGLSEKIKETRKLQNSLENSQKQNQNLVKKIEQSEGKSQQWKKKEKNLQIEIKQLKNQLEESSKINQSLQQNHNKQLKDQKKINQSINNQLKEQTQINQNLKNQLKDQQKLNQSINNQLEDYKKHNQNVHNQLNQQKQINQKFQNQLKSQQKLNQTLKQKLISIDKSIQLHCVEINLEIDTLKSGKKLIQQPTRDRIQIKPMQGINSIAESIERCLNETKTKVKTHSFNYKDSISKLQEKINERTIQNDSLIKSNQFLQQSINSIEKLNISYEQNDKKQFETIKNLNSITENLNKKIQSQSEAIRKLEQKLNQSQSKVSELNKQIKALKSKLMQSECNLRKLTQQREKQTQDATDKLKKLSQQLQTKTEDLERIQNQYLVVDKKLNQACEQLQVIKKTKCFTQFFNGNILNVDTPTDTEWFVTNIEKSLDKRIKATRLLYRFDLENKTSFHHYFDNKPNIVLIVKMQNGQTIAAYSEPPFKPLNNTDYCPGLMFGFNNRKVFSVKTQPTNEMNRTVPRPITYDDNYIIWGNSDILIKLGSNELYSSYATSNCCYEEKGNQNPLINDLFQQKNRDTYLVDYELYQVIFE